MSYFVRALILVVVVDATTITVDVDAPVATTAPSFVGVNIDAASLYQGARLDFTDPHLRALACRIGAEGAERATLRIGGSAADDLSTFVNDTTHGQIFLNEKYWDEIVAFVDECNLALAWDLNMRVGRNPDASRPWDPQDARRLLGRATGKGQGIWALQLGNEPGHWLTRDKQGHPTAAEHGADFLALAALLDDYYGEGGAGAALPRPRMQGPDVCLGALTDTEPCADIAYFSDLLGVASGNGTGPVIDDITVHSYGLTGPPKGNRSFTQCDVSDFLNATAFRAQVLPAVAAWQRAARDVMPSANLVLSETATAADGGCPGLSNRFVAGFYFLDALGELGAMGVHQVYRQDLVGFSGIGGGSSYALAGPPGWFSARANGPLSPNPDFFLTLLYRRLVGARRLRAVAPPTIMSTGARVHAACAAGGGIVVSFINPASHSLAFGV
eukprot:Hpha_TRINITY_DN6495_c0_g2::TRINITY_DN6495_c0_g2_i1::g.73::m.73/K07964/HPSE; heparanase